MVKLINTGYTDYPDNVCRPIRVLSFDGGKYCRVQFLEDAPVRLEPRTEENGETRIVDHSDYINEDGTWTIKRGYVSQTPFTHDSMEDYKNLRRVDWHVLEGKSRQSFRPRSSKTQWHVYIDTPGRENPVASSKADAIYLAQVEALRTNEMVQVGHGHKQNGNGGYHSQSNNITLEVYPDGRVLELNNDRCHHGHGARVAGMKAFIQPKYLRGFNKGKECPRQPIWAWDKR
jgi:hypothetical protein